MQKKPDKSQKRWENEKDNGQGFLFSEEENEKLQEELKTGLQKQFISFDYVSSSGEHQEYIYIPEKQVDDDVIPPSYDNDFIKPIKAESLQREFAMPEVQKMTSQAELERKEKEQAEAEKEFRAKRATILDRLPYFPNPTNDDELLLNYQHDFLKYDDQKAWGKLLELAFTVTQRLVWRYLKKNKKTAKWFDEEDQAEKVTEAVYYVLRRYKTRPDWFVSKNYIGALIGGVWHAMEYATELDKATYSCEDVNIELCKNQNC